MQETILSRRGCAATAIFTDLDGSLLDHHTYSFEDARPALECIRDRRIPLVFTSSKTRFEIEALQAILGIREPFIVENGAAVFFPEGYRGWQVPDGRRAPPYTVIRLGASYSEIRRWLQALPPGFSIRGFGDLSVEDVGRLSGLAPGQVSLAKQREFTEPFLIEDDLKLADLRSLAEAAGFTITRGGRFHHLMGLGQDKGVAVRRAAAVIRRNTSQPLCTIGLGDSANDAAMLQSVDIPILIPHPDGSYEELDAAGLRKARHPGSRGWNEAILELLSSPGGSTS
jgi:mannosyl-3-phosphoglycerate phosphatase